LFLETYKNTTISITHAVNFGMKVPGKHKHTHLHSCDKCVLTNVATLW